MIIETLIAGLIVMMASLMGIFFVQKAAEQFLENRLSLLISFSAGVFLVTAVALSLEVFELVPTIFVGALLIALGYALAWVLQVLMPETHHHHDPNCAHGHGVAAKKLIIGDSIHNVADGVILVVAFATSPLLGMAATLSIFIHEALQEVSEFFVLKQAGYSTKKALMINLSVSSTILIGIFLGHFALASHELEFLLLAVSAGFFLHVVFHDLFPKPSQHERGSQFLLHVLLVITGALLMGVIANTLGDSHAHLEADRDTLLVQ